MGNVSRKVKAMKQGKKQQRLLRVLVMSQQNKLDRVLMANLHNWGYEALIVPLVIALQNERKSYTKDWIPQTSNEGGQKSRVGMTQICMDEECNVEGDILLYDIDESSYDVTLSARSDMPGWQSYRSYRETSEMWYASQGVYEREQVVVPKTRFSIVFSSQSIARTTLEYFNAMAVLQKPFEMGRLHRYLQVVERLLYPPAQVERIALSCKPHERMRVLVVDDDVDIAAAIQQCLVYEAENRYDVMVAHDGLDALEKCLDWEPHCMVIDVIMPLMNGYQVMRCLSAGDLSAMPAFVIMSALTHFEVPVNRTYLTGKTVVYVNKPFLIDDLLTALEQVCTK